MCAPLASGVAFVRDSEGVRVCQSGSRRLHATRLGAGSRAASPRGAFPARTFTGWRCRSRRGPLGRRAHRPRCRCDHRCRSPVRRRSDVVAFALLSTNSRFGPPRRMLGDRAEASDSSRAARPSRCVGCGVAAVGSVTIRAARRPGSPGSDARDLSARYPATAS